MGDADLLLLIFSFPLFFENKKTEAEENADLLDYDDDEAAEEQANETAGEGGEKKNTGAYVSIHSSGFRDFLLKPELMKAIVDCGFEHPSAGEC